MIYCIKPQYLQKSRVFNHISAVCSVSRFFVLFLPKQAALGNRNEGTAYMRDAHPACTLNQRNILQTKWK